MEFEVEIMRDIVRENTDEFDVIEETIIDTSRWAIHHEMVFQSRETGKYYRTYFRRGATEMQEEQPFEYENGMIQCEEVVKQAVIKQEWVKV